MQQVAQSLEALARITELTQLEGERWATARDSVPKPQPPGRRETETLIEWYQRAAAAIEAARGGRPSVSAWSSSGQRQDADQDPPHLAHYVLRAFYDDLYQRVYAPLRAGDAAAVDLAWEFLEANVRCFRSGYFAEDLARLLGHHQLTNAQQQRLQVVMLDRVRKGSGRELRSLLRLAPKLDRSRLLQAVAPLLVSDDLLIAQRSAWLLSRLTKPVLPAEILASAQTVLVRIASAPHLEYPTTKQVQELALAFMTKEFRMALLQQVAAQPTNPAPFRLLACAPGEVPLRYRAPVHAWLLLALDSARETAWIAQLAAKAADEALKAELLARTDSPEPATARYARRALTAMGR